MIWMTATPPATARRYIAFSSPKAINLSAHPCNRKHRQLFNQTNQTWKTKERGEAVLLYLFVDLIVRHVVRIHLPDDCHALSRVRVLATRLGNVKPVTHEARDAVGARLGDSNLADLPCVKVFVESRPLPRERALRTAAFQLKQRQKWIFLKC